MNQVERDMMLSMINILNEASDAYYNGKSLIMSDTQYDERLKDLQEFEKETGMTFSNSPTINVGAKILNNLPEVEHNHLMLSLEKVHSSQEIIDFADNKELVASIKLDGMTVSLLYENGELIRAESRGNGYIGVDITEHVKKFKNIPMRIDKTGTYIIDGECIITDEDFAEINKDNEFKNSRNTVAGTLNSLDTSLVSKRKLRFMAWDVIEGGNNNNLNDNLCEAESLGFDVVPHWNLTNFDKPKNIQNTIDYVFDFVEEEGLPCDGIVFKFNDIEYGKSLGFISHHFNNGIAYKAQDEVYETELIDVEFSVGKTGTLTPTAVFKPVEIEGTTVERASVHNISILEDLNLCIGDKIEVYKANMVIPQVKRNISAEQRQYADALEVPTINKINYCPMCGAETEIKQDNNSKILVCTNDNCKGKLLGKLSHFVSKNAMNIDGLSEATLEKFIDLNYINSFLDIYELKNNFCEDIIKLEGFGKKSVSKLMASIEDSKNTTLDRFIYALSIPLIGKSASKTIAKHFNYDFKRFYREGCLTYFNYEVLEDFGYQMATSMQIYIDENMYVIEELAKYMNFEIPDEIQNNANITGKTFVITGTINHFANRDELKNKIENLGGKVTGSVTKKTDYLINNDINSTSGKNKKAKNLGIKIITEDELMEMFN